MTGQPPLPVLRLSPAGSTPAPVATTVTPANRSSPPADDRAIDANPTSQEA